MDLLFSGFVHVISTRNTPALGIILKLIRTKALVTLGVKHFFRFFFSTPRHGTEGNQ